MLLDDLPRGVVENQTQYAPIAAWMNEAVLRRTFGYKAAQGNRILLGHIDGSPLGVADDRHILTVAGSRAGKGVSTIVPNLLLYRGSVLAIDPKGELASITARARDEDLGQKVCVLDPFGITSSHCAPYRSSFNPLSILRPDNPNIIEDAGLIADALVIASSHEAHWDESARTFIEGVLLLVATCDELPGDRDLVTVWRLIARGIPGLRDDDDDEVPPMEGLQAVMIQHGQTLGGDLGYAIEAAAADFFDRPASERASVLSTARRHVRFLGYPALRSVLEGHNFDLGELKTANKGMTVYLCLPAGRMGTCSRWFRLFVNLVLQAMEREEKRPAIPVLLVLDEFPILGHMRQIEDAAGQIAGFGVKLWPILQDIGQIKALYQDRCQTFMGNAGVLQFFGNNDIDTLEYISRRLGKTTIRVQQGGADTTQEQRLQGLRGVSRGQEVHDLITPDEAARFFRRDDPKGRQLIICPGYPAAIMQRFVYYEDDLFRGVYDVI